MLKLLIAEDELPERMGLVALLNRYYKDKIQICSQAGNGREAVIAFRHENPDIIFMDINMPEMDGLQAAEKMKEMNSAIPIILITAYSSFNYAKRALQIGVTDYIVKPYSIKTLQQTIDRVIMIEVQKKENQLEIEGIRELVHMEEKRIPHSPREKAICDSVCSYIDSHYKEKISLNELSSHIGLSRYHLSRLFKESVGMGIKEYHIRKRISESQYYLKLGYSISETAYAVGFSDPNYFSRIVKNYTGQTAKELIKNSNKVQK